MNALFSASKCPLCEKKINKYLLIPVLSFVILRGKCGNCGNKISKLYPVFEIIYGVLFLYIISINGFSFLSFNIFIILGTGIIISYIDVKIYVIPDSLIILFLLLSIYPIILNYSFKDNIYGFLLMFLFFLVILLLFPGAFGGGDVKFASAIGLFSGLEFSVVALETALISGAITGLFIVIKSGKSLKSKIAFGPFLTLGLFVSYFFGRDIILIYYNFLVR